MRPMLTPEEMARADRATIASGTPQSVLVERAGAAVAWHARRMLGGGYGRRVVVVCGKGNNGADGRVAARRLREWGVRTDVFALEAGLDRAVVSRSLARADLAIDAMLGTGFSGSLGGDAEWAAAAFGGAGVPVLAVDVPSGVDGLTGAVRGAAVAATETACLAALKPGLLFEPGRSLSGRVRVHDIGVDVEAGRGAGGADAPPRGATSASDVAAAVALNPRLRDPAAHKWAAAVLVVGGSRGMTGAPVLAGRAAARTGAGMVVVALPGVEAASAASGTELVVRALASTADGCFDDDAARSVVRDLAPRFGAVALGPGMGRDDRAAAMAQRVVAEVGVPVVVDADGLNALADDPSALRVRHAAGLPRAVLTPHAGEYERLAGEPVGEDRVAAALRLAERTRAVVLLKGPGTVVATPGGRVAVCPIGGAELAAAGTGDVLTGVVAALLAFGAEPFEAASCAAWLQAWAAVEAGAGASLVASDLLATLGPTLASIGPDVPED